MKINSEECNLCSGKGYLLIEKREIQRCSKCLGEGELDWIEQIIGSKKEVVSTSSSLINRYRTDIGNFLDCVTYRYYSDCGKLL